MYMSRVYGKNGFSSALVTSGVFANVQTRLRRKLGASRTLYPLTELRCVGDAFLRICFGTCLPPELRSKETNQSSVSVSLEVIQTKNALDAGFWFRKPHQGLCTRLTPSGPSQNVTPLALIEGFLTNLNHFLMCHS